MRKVLSVVSAIVLIATAARSLYGQAAPATGTARVTLVSAPTLVTGAPTLVRRHPGRTIKNVITVDPAATAEDLAYAIGMMNALRAQYGETMTFDVRATSTRTRLGNNWSRSEYRTWLVQQLARLRQAQARQLPDLGRVQAVHISLPAPTGRVVTPRSSRAR